MKLLNLPLIIVFCFLIFPCNAEFSATCQEISPPILERMKYTWRSDAPVHLKDLCYITLSYYDVNGDIKQGELVVHKKVVEDLISIFEKLFEVQFPIQSMTLVDEFEGSDEASMRANNTSAFYARKVAGTHRWSNHATGLAIDINPLLNPYSKGSYFCPPEGMLYLDRTLNIPGMITKGSYIYQLFKERGWQWGGECFFERDGVIDRHHFQKVISGVNKTTN